MKKFAKFRQVLGSPETCGWLTLSYATLTVVFLAFGDYGNAAVFFCVTALGGFTYAVMRWAEGALDGDEKVRPLPLKGADVAVWLKQTDYIRSRFRAHFLLPADYYYRPLRDDTARFWFYDPERSRLVMSSGPFVPGIFATRDWEAFHVSKRPYAAPDGRFVVFATDGPGGELFPFLVVVAVDKECAGPALLAEYKEYVRDTADA